MRVSLLVGLLAPATAIFASPAVALERAQFSVVAYLGLAATLLSWDLATGRARAVRGWIAFGGFATWSLMQALKNVEGAVALPLSPDALLIVLTIGAAGAYRAVLVGRVPWREELAIYLDAAVVTATVGAAVIATLAQSALTDPHLAAALLYAIVFAGILAATAILDLAVLAELRLRGAYILLAGIAALAAGFVVRALAEVGAAQDSLTGLVMSAGVLLVAYGTATWSEVTDERPAYARFAVWLRGIAPITAVVLTPLLLLQPTGDSLVVLAAQGLSAFALVGVVTRQSLLLQERQGMVGSLTAAQEQLAHRALHDPLTGLPNRTLLMDRLEHALKRRGQPTVAVLFVDLDRFKLINDTLGHEAGDQVLLEVARQLSAALRPTDTAARVGGDEFAAVLEDLAGPADAAVIAERVREQIGGLTINVRAGKVRVHASIGIAISEGESVAAGDLLRNADIAMYAAKTSGGGRTAVFREAMYERLVAQREIEQLLVAERRVRNASRRRRRRV